MSLFGKKPVYTYDLYPYTCRLKDGHYRIYDEKGQEVWKSKGKKEKDKIAAQEKINALFQTQSHGSIKEDLDASQQTLQDSLRNQKDLTNEERKKQQKLLDFLTAARARAYKTGESFEDIIKEWALDREKIPENLQGEEGLDDETFNQLMTLAKSPSNLQSMMETIEEKQSSRRNALESLYEKERDKEQSLADELSLMTDPNVGTEAYQSLWDAMTEEQKESLTPDQLRRLGLERDLDKGKQESFKQGELLSGLMPDQDGFNLNWNDQPSYDAAKNIWEQDYKPKYIYGNAKPFDQREHELAASGHGMGSSSLEGNASDKERSLYREDLENIRLIQNMLESSHRARGDTIGQLDQLATASRNTFGAPVERGANLMHNDLKRAGDEAYRDKVFHKDLAEAEMNLGTAEMGEDLNAHLLKDNQIGQELQQYQGLANQVYQFGMLSENLSQLGAEKQQEYALMQEQLWQNRAQIVAMLRKLNMQEEAFELQKAEKNKEDFMQKLMLIAKIGGTVALAAMGQPVAAASLWAPNLASTLGTGGGGANGGGSSWFGGSAQAGVGGAGA
jgi:hypothetical protein